MRQAYTVRSGQPSIAAIFAADHGSSCFTKSTSGQQKENCTLCKKCLRLTAQCAVI